jgi:hypothetical protein
MEYVSPLGRPAITDWRNGLTTATRKADLDAFLKLKVTEEEWTSPDLRSLKGKQLKGLYELRWRSDGVPHRIGGFITPPNTFVMLVGFTHNAKKYDPPSALETLLKRRKQILNEEAILNEFKVITGKRAE